MRVLPATLLTMFVPRDPQGLAECLDETIPAEDADVMYPASCAHLKAAFSFLPSTMYYVRPSNDAAPFAVYCDMETQK